MKALIFDGVPPPWRGSVHPEAPWLPCTRGRGAYVESLQDIVLPSTSAA